MCLLLEPVAYQYGTKLGNKMIKITRKRIENAVIRQATTTQNPAFCANCGSEQSGEPDAIKIKCVNCNEHSVYGIMIFAERLG